MASPEARHEALVLKKTKLGESDLILHLMASDGSALRAVAKGARKPRNASSATLDLFNRVQLTIVAGKSLGIAKGSRLLEHHSALHTDPARFAAASVIAEAADAVIQPDLPVANLYEMTCVALSSASVAEEVQLPLIPAAYGFKLTALLGMRPSFAACAICGEPLQLLDARTRFSYEDGGAICDLCAQAASTTSVSTEALKLCGALMGATFADLAHGGGNPAAWDAAAMAERWLENHAAAHLRSFSSFKAICGCLQASTVL